MKKNWALTQESFDNLLAWLHPNREEAGKKYERIRRELIKLFLRWGSDIPEELADETINRIAQKVDGFAEEYRGDPANYFLVVARTVYREYHPSMQRTIQHSTTPPLLHKQQFPNK